MTAGFTIEFKRDAAPDPDDKPPFRVIGDNPPRIVGRGALYLREEPATTYQFLCIAANERPAMLAEIERQAAEIERLRQAVVDACEACARRFDAKAAGYRAMQSRLLGERQFLEADDAGKAAEDIEAIAAAIRARSTP